MAVSKRACASASCFLRSRGARVIQRAGGAGGAAVAGRSGAGAVGGLMGEGAEGFVRTRGEVGRSGMMERVWMAQLHSWKARRLGNDAMQYHGMRSTDLRTYGVECMKRRYSLQQPETTISHEIVSNLFAN